MTTTSEIVPGDGADSFLSFGLVEEVGDFDEGFTSLISSAEMVAGLRVLRLPAAGADFFISFVKVAAGLFVRLCVFLFSGLANSNDLPPDVGVEFLELPALLLFADEGEVFELVVGVVEAGEDFASFAEAPVGVLLELVIDDGGPSKLKRFCEVVLEYELFDRLRIIKESSKSFSFCLYT